MPTITATPARSAGALDGNGQGRRRWKALLVTASSVALTLTLLPAAVASAEPDRSATLNRANPTFTWESSGTGVEDPSRGFSYGPAMFRCTGAPFMCEYILLDVENAGELTLTLDGTDVVCGDSPCQRVQDIDGHLYRSNAAGEPIGRNLTNYDCATVSSSETCKVAVAPGIYVLEVEYYRAVEASYIGTAELDVAAAPGPPAAAPQMIPLAGCNFTLYYFKDSAERLQALVPPGYRVRPYQPYPLDSPLVTTQGSATIAAAAYDCDRIEVPGSSAPGIFTVLSVLVHPPDETFELPASSDFYVVSIHANNPQLVELLASRGMPADLVPGMVFDKPMQSLGVRVEVPWSQGAYELAATGFFQDVFHTHDNAYLHETADGRLARMDFVTPPVRDQSCNQQSDHHAVQCGKLTAEAGTPVAGFFGASDRSAHDAWDHDPIERAWLELHSCRRPPATAGAPPCLSSAGANDHEHQHQH